MKDGLRPTGGQFGGGFHIAETAGLLREGPGLLRRHWSSALSGEAGPGLLISPEVGLAAHQEEAAAQAGEAGQPVEVEAVEARGGHDGETEQSHVNILGLGQLTVTLSDLVYDECH